MARAPHQGSIFGPRILTQEEAQTEASRVLSVWGELREASGRTCTLTAKRKEPITRALLEGRSGDDLITYLRWVFTSDERWPGWMRKDGRDYTEPANLFRPTHLETRLDDAVAWGAAEEDRGPTWFAVYGDRVYSG